MTLPVAQAPGRERNVLIFPGGTKIALEIRQSLVTCKEIRVFSAAEPTSNHAPFVYAVHDEVPSMSDKTWFDALRAIIQRRSIDYLLQRAAAADPLILPVDYLFDLVGTEEAIGRDEAES